MIDVAFVGSGRIADMHFMALSAFKDRCRLVGICDPSEAARRTRSRQFGAPAFADVDEMLAAVSPQAVVIMVPPAAVSQVMSQCLGRVPNILLEKPIGVTIVEARLLVEQADRTGTVVLVGHNGLFHPDFRVASELIAGGAIGTVVSASAESAGWLDLPDADFRRSRSAAGGGVWMDTGSHPLYCLRAIMGDISEVCGMTGNLCRPEMEGEDHAFMVLRFAGSALAGIQASYGRKRPNWQDGWPSGYRLEMTFWGTAGAVRYRLCPEPLLEIADDSAWKRIGTGASFVSSFICQFEHFLDCVDGGAAPKATLRDGLEVLAALRAGYETRSQTDKVDA